MRIVKTYDDTKYTKRSPLKAIIGKLSTRYLLRLRRKTRALWKSELRFKILCKNQRYLTLVCMTFFVAFLMRMMWDDYGRMLWFRNFVTCQVRMPQWEKRNERTEIWNFTDAIIPLGTWLKTFLGTYWSTKIFPWIVTWSKFRSRTKL